MKKYILVPIMLTPIFIWSLLSGIKSGESQLGLHKKPITYTSSKKIYSEEILRKDFEEIRNILTSRHPAPYQFTGKAVFEKFYEDQLQKINRPMNLGEYFLIAAPLVEAVHCGHTWTSLPDEFWNNDEEMFFPIGLIFSGNKAYAAATQNSSSVPKGSEIISINKILLSEIIESTKRLVNSDAKSSTGKLANFGHSFPDLFAIQYGNHEGYEVSFVTPQSTGVHVLTLKPVSRIAAWNNPIGTLAGFFSGGDDLRLEISNSDKPAVISIPTFGYYDNQKKFYNFLDSAFEKIHQAGIKTLILDLRNNSGGDPICASRLLSYLERHPAPYFARTYQGYEALAKPIPVSIKNAFSGNLYVLINGGCFSTTGHLCALLKFSKRAIFVGEETGGTYECNDDHIEVQTAVTHLNLNVARMTYTTAVKGISRETGIVPDYPAEPTIDDVLAGTDAVKNYAIKLKVKSQLPGLSE